jgi:hypothetical protein
MDAVSNSLSTVISQIQPSGGVTSNIAVALVGQINQAETTQADILLSTLGIGKNVSSAG